MLHACCFVFIVIYRNVGTIQLLIVPTDGAADTTDFHFHQVESKFQLNSHNFCNSNSALVVDFSRAIWATQKYVYFEISNHHT